METLIKACDHTKGKVTAFKNYIANKMMDSQKKVSLDTMQVLDEIKRLEIIERFKRFLST